MAATDPRPLHNQQDASSGPAARTPADRAPTGAIHCLSNDELYERLDEEIGRAGRHGTSLCALLLRLDDFEEIAQAYGVALSERALLHAGETLLGQLRRFDRVGRPRQDELLIVLPGAAGIEGEAVARRALRRLRAIKIEVDRARRPLGVCIGIAAWRSPWNASQLIEEARCVAGLSRQGAGD
jgi:diguanylate cyclase (GGDEF)-like protein